MFNYIRYLSLYALHKVTLLIIYIVGIAGYVALTLMMAKDVNTHEQSPTTYITSVSTLGVFVPFTISILFVIFMFVYLFKDGEQDGSELLILTKPITRAKIIISKFIVLLMFTFVYSMSYILIAYLTSLGDKLATGSEQVKYAFSMGIGMFVIMIILGPIIALIGSFLNKIGTVAVGILIATFFPIISMIITPVTSGVVSNASDIGVSTSGSYVADLSKLDFTNKANNYNMSSIDTQDINKVYYTLDMIVDGKESVINKTKFDKYNKDLSYDGVAYVDFWYQWSRFYGLFIDEKPTQQQAYKYVKADSTSKVSLSKEAGLKINVNGATEGFETVNYFYNNYPNSFVKSTTNPDYGLVVDPTKNNEVKSETIDLFKRWLEAPAFTIPQDPNGKKNKEYFFEVKSLQGRLAIIQSIFETSRKVSSPEFVSFYFASEESVAKAMYDSENAYITTANEVVMIYKYLEMEYIKNDESKMPLLFAETDIVPGTTFQSFSRFFIKNDEQLNKLGSYVDNKTKYEFIVLEPFMKTWAIVLIWSIFGMLFIGLAMWRYMRIDFK